MASGCLMGAQLVPQARLCAGAVLGDGCAQGRPGQGHEGQPSSTKWGKEEGWLRRKPGDGKGSSGHMCMEQRVTRCRQWVTV